MVQTLTKQPTKMETCPSYGKCSAPLCPLDDKTLQTCIWYPDEPICVRHNLPDTKWLKVQRRIAKRTKNRDTFYRLSDLRRIRRVSPSIKGHNPNIMRWDKGLRGGSETSGDKQDVPPPVEIPPQQKTEGKTRKQPVAQGELLLGESR